MKPNIVFAFADDWGRYASIYSRISGSSPSMCENVSTPNFDQIAKDGVLFLNALVPAPTCTPCRSSILSGQYFWQTGLGAILSGAIWDETIKTFPLELEKHGGYFIGYQYKVWSPGRTQNAPIGGARTRYEPSGRNFNQFSHWVTEHSEKLGISNAKNILYEETRNNFRYFLHKRPKSKPFFYWWGPTNTHRSWEKGSGKNLWGIDPDFLKGKLPKFLPDVHDIREDAADYLGEVQAVDFGLGILLEELKLSGELENTLFVVSGDHGIPGMPRAKCNLYDIGCDVALAASWPGIISPGRVIDDFVNLMDLAPTFCEAGGIDIPEKMRAKSLLPILLSEESGKIDRDRNFVVTGRERHMVSARDQFLPYPQRAIRVENYIYIFNFEPDRWPMGDPKDLEEIPTKTYDYRTLLYDFTIAPFQDMDPSPTKAWMINHREDEDIEPLYHLSFGKRPQEELYDLRKDPDYMNNVAMDPLYQEIRRLLKERLFSVLTLNDDPRVTEEPCWFEYPPYAGPLSQEQIPDPRDIQDVVSIYEGTILDSHSLLFRKDDD